MLLRLTEIWYLLLYSLVLCHLRLVVIHSVMLLENCGLRGVAHPWLLLENCRV